MKRSTPEDPRKLAVIAFGGNALLRPEDRGTNEEQIARAKQAARWLAEFPTRGYRLIVVHGNGPQVGNILLYAVDELLVGGTKVGSGGVGGIITSPRGGEARVEIARAGEALADDAGAYDLSIFLDQLSVGFLGKDDLRQASYDQWINDPQQYRGRDGHQKCSNNVFLHSRFLLCKSDSGDHHVNQLDPNEGNQNAAEAIDP